MDKHLAESFPAGEQLATELDERGWSQAEFAEILGRPVQFVSEIMAGKKEITRESAAQIGAALGTSATFWLDLQNAYLLGKQSQDDGTQRQLDLVRRRAQLINRVPVALLRKRGLLKADDVEHLEAEVLELFEISSLDEELSFSIAARRTNKKVPLTALQQTWLAVARKAARALAVPAYDETKLAAIAPTLSQLLDDPEPFRALPEVLAVAGVRLVYVEAFPGSKMDGATFLLDDDPSQPVVAISGRGRRLDIVLFTILHELAHLIRGDVTPGHIVVDDETHTLGDEGAADATAANWAVPDGALTDPPRPVRQHWVLQQAARYGVNPIVIVGQLQKRGAIEWKTQLVRGAPTVSAQLASWN